MMKLTTRAWNQISNDYKNIDANGQKYMLRGTTLGTCLIPVEIDDVNGCEYQKYAFTEYGIAYHVYAYSQEEAEEIVQLSGHCMSLVNDLHLATA